MPLNCVLKNGLKGKFYAIYILTRKRKRKKGRGGKKRGRERGRKDLVV